MSRYIVEITILAELIENDFECNGYFHFMLQIIS